MSQVYWERQGADLLCGVHCLNALLQGPVYTESDLAYIAQQLDAKEAQLIQGQTGPSQNVDESGNFSVGVLMEALQAKCGAQLVNLNHRELKHEVLSKPEQEQGFVCNLHAHWYAIRRVGTKWWNLNSLRQGAPTQISEFSLAAFLDSVANSGWTVFVVRGAALPQPQRNFDKMLQGYQMYLTEADVAKGHEDYKKKEQREMDEAQRIGGGGGGGEESSGPAFHMTVPADQRKQQETDWSKLGAGNSLGGGGGGGGGASSGMAGSTDDPELAAALAASMQDAQDSLPLPPDEAPADSKEACLIKIQPGGAERRFFKSNTLLDVCVWLEYLSTSAEGPSALGTSALVTCSSYALLTSDRKKIVRQHGQSIRIGEQNVSEKTLKECGFMSRERLTLQVN